MALSKFLVGTFSAVVVVAAAACADGTGTPFTPTLPSSTNTAANADGTTLKASAPTPQAPPADAQVANRRPTLTVANAAGTYEEVPLSYVFQLYEGDTLVQQTDSVTGSSQSASWEVPTNLLNYDRSYRWRARALSDGQEGLWSAFSSFRTPVAPVAENSSEGGPVPCAGSSGDEIVQCVAAAYPEKRAARVSLEVRKDNMAFLRDRIIETAICKGINMGRNFKRGTPVISHDFAVLRQPGKHDRGVDLARGYDDLSTRLQLGWMEWSGPSFGHPFYAKYPPVDCSGVN